MNPRKLLFALVLLTPFLAYAGAIETLETSLRSAISATSSTLETTAVLWLSSFVMIQFLITQLGLLKSGADLEAIWAKLLSSLLWFGFCFYVMQEGKGFIGKTSEGFFTTAANISGAGKFNAAFIIDSGATLAGNLLGKINSASGITDVFMPAIVGGLLGCVILATAAYIGFKVFIIKLETLIIVMLAPLSFAFLGLNALRDQGIAPFKALVSLLYRIVLLAVILGTMKSMSDNLVNVIQGITSDSLEGIWDVLFAAVCGYLLLAFLTHKSDSIAASLASGSTQLGTSDAATAAAIGAAVGGAVGAAGASMGAGKVPQAMSDFMHKAFGGNGVGVSNATPDTGSGGVVGTAPSKTPSMSMSSAGAGGASSAGERGGEAEGGDEAQASNPSETFGADNAQPAHQESQASAAATTALGGGTPNQLPEVAAAEKRKNERNAAREQRRQERSGGSASTAGLEGGSDAPVKPGVQPGQKKSFRERMSDLNQHVAQESAAVHVSINTHHE